MLQIIRHNNLAKERKLLLKGGGGTYAKAGGGVNIFLCFCILLQFWCIFQNFFPNAPSPNKIYMSVLRCVCAWGGGGDLSKRHVAGKSFKCKKKTKKNTNLGIAKSLGGISISSFHLFLLIKKKILETSFSKKSKELY